MNAVAPTLIQQMNMQFVDIPPAPKRGRQDDSDLSDIQRVVRRIGGIYAHQSMTWLEISTNWRPGTQTGYRKRSFWSLRRLGKAIDQAVAEGLIEDTDGSDCEWRLTEAGKRYFMEATS
ncbi:hypothetical protein [Marinobacter sp. CA1]|uniref:hypothetical protein n=1 Tax=Marinobacter sp. CA1 TaxID=2817656 RepID=UPI001D065225|nr:hypothetical protein [Marinobacter sp. CA1]UDL04016.1 hypothetical protein J2887_15010 [Marinobacter sp. CA1]